MKRIDIEELLEGLGEIEDKRRQWGNLRHKLTEILFISLCAIMCGMEDIDGIVIFGEERQEWLRKYIELKNGVPSAATYERVLRMLDPKEVEKFYRSWAKALHEEAGTSQISIDGKTICGAGAAQKVHMVSAWAKEDGLCLGQIRTEEKSNEITAIPELLKLIDVSECVVSIDAMGCQKKIAEAIREKDADYLLAVKGNQAALNEGIREYMESIVVGDEPEAIVDCWDSGYEKGHGRIERRIVTVCACPEWKGVTDEWKDIHTLIRYDCIREKMGRIEEKVDKKAATNSASSCTRYYISSIRAVDAKLISGYLRGHWAIENQLHWMLDVVFREDSSTVRMNHAPENLNILRKTALSLLRSTPSSKRMSTRAKLAKAALNPEFLSLALFGK
jgi:predicted transposase YbfD/YdcC